MNHTDQTADFDGCRRACRQQGAHTLRRGECEHAPEPEPAVSLSRVSTAPDGFPSIVFDRYTAPQLAELIRSALRGVKPVLLSDGEYSALARAAAHAIVHRNDAPAAPAAVVSPPTSLAVELDRLRTENERMRHELEVMYGGAFDDPEREQADRAAIRSAALLEAADAVAAMDFYKLRSDFWFDSQRDAWDCGQRDAEDLLRRLAAEAQPESGSDPIGDYLKFLRGQGPEPDLSGLPPEQREAAVGQFEIVRALADRDPGLPPLDRDPVARRLGLRQPAAEAQQQPDTEARRCIRCTHPKGDHDGRADHRAKHTPRVAGEPWCHACNATCDYADEEQSAPDLTERKEQYAVAIHDAMESELSLVDQEPGYQALFARAAEAAMALADAEAKQPTTEAEAAATLARECVDRPAVIRWCADRVRSTDGDYAVLAAAEYLDDLATEIEEAAETEPAPAEEQPAAADDETQQDGGQR